VAFVVETGAGLSTATSYLSVADFKTYHNDRGTDWSTYGDPEIQSALIVAADYIDRRYSYKGLRRLGRDQALEWPRIGSVDKYGQAIDGASVPPEITEPSADLAWIQLTEGLFQSVDFDSSGGQLTEVTDQVGSVKRTRRYSDEGGGSTKAWKIFPSPDAALLGISSQADAATVRA
tara:strand:- start:1520 stop:2047 length:528 start_codon:yes stop_codon:yes gene_type:complete